LTGWIIGVCFVALVLYDVVIYFERTPDDTITHLIRDWGERHPSVPTAVGVLVGHWFWPVRRSYPESGPWVLLGLGIGLVALDLLGKLPAVPPLSCILLGAALSGWLWGPVRLHGRL
jgi:hypothetical protein